MGEDAIPGGLRGGDRSDARRRLTVAQAADALGVTVDAVRSRIKRETIDYVRDGGRVYVMLGVDQGAASTDQPTDHVGDQGSDHSTNVDSDPREELLEELRDRVRYLEEESRRKDHLLAAALERIPAIEAPRDVPETASEGEGRGDVPPEHHEPVERRSRSWWRRFFGFE